MGFRRRRWRDLRPEEEKIRVNKRIRVPEVRVVNEDGRQLGVMPTDAALDIAERSGLDLVEISPNGQPPVCKIMDYGRYKFEQKKKASEARKTQHQTQVKEVKFRPQISDHDLGFKLRNARKFLFDGDKVKCIVMFRGREIVYTNLGRELLMRVADMMKEIATLEQSPKLEGRAMAMTLAPIRPAIERLKKQEEKSARAEGENGTEARSDEAEGSEASEPESAEVLE
ncbi:MAG: translation initiation factor IF-3 [Myxococcota bacterium]